MPRPRKTNRIAYSAVFPHFKGRYRQDKLDHSDHWLLGFFHRKETKFQACGVVKHRWTHLPLQTQVLQECIVNCCTIFKLGFPYKLGQFFSIVNCRNSLPFSEVASKKNTVQINEIEHDWEKIYVPAVQYKGRRLLHTFSSDLQPWHVWENNRSVLNCKLKEL